MAQKVTLRCFRCYLSGMLVFPYMVTPLEVTPPFTEALNRPWLGIRIVLATQHQWTLKSLSLKKYIMLVLCESRSESTRGPFGFCRVWPESPWNI